MGFTFSRNENRKRFSFTKLKFSLIFLYMEYLKSLWSTPPDRPLNLLDVEDFDVLLFRGQQSLFSYVIEYGTWSDFSHVGLVLRGFSELDDQLTDLYMLESGFQTSPDAYEHKQKFGVRLSNLAQVCKEYDGQIYVRQLKASPAQKARMKSQLARLYPSIKDDLYDDCVKDIVRVGLDLNIGDNQRTDRFFCSALASFIFVKLGLLESSLKWDLVRPKDFGSDFIARNLLEGELDELIRIK
jgi:hypothetical protein